MSKIKYLLLFPYLILSPPKIRYFSTVHIDPQTSGQLQSVINIASLPVLRQFIQYEEHISRKLLCAKIRSEIEKYVLNQKSEEEEDNNRQDNNLLDDVDLDINIEFEKARVCRELDQLELQLAQLKALNQNIINSRSNENDNDDNQQERLNQPYQTRNLVVKEDEIISDLLTLKNHATALECNDGDLTESINTKSNHNYEQIINECTKLQNIFLTVDNSISLNKIDFKTIMSIFFVTTENRLETIASLINLSYQWSLPSDLNSESIENKDMNFANAMLIPFSLSIIPQFIQYWEETSRMLMMARYQLELQKNTLLEKASPKNQVKTIKKQIEDLKAKINQKKSIKPSAGKATVSKQKNTAMNFTYSNAARQSMHVQLGILQAKLRKLEDEDIRYSDDEVWSRASSDTEDENYEQIQNYEQTIARCTALESIFELVNEVSCANTFNMNSLIHMFFATGPSRLQTLLNLIEIIELYQREKIQEECNKAVKLLIDDMETERERLNQELYQRLAMQSLASQESQARDKMQEEYETEVLSLMNHQKSLNLVIQTYNPAIIAVIMSGIISKASKVSSCNIQETAMSIWYLREIETILTFILKH